MNEIARPQIKSQEVNPISMMFDPVIADRVLKIAETLAVGKVSVPDHLRGNVGDCLAIVMQAASWRLNPFAVAQKTHLIHGRLGYEAQLVSAVVSSLGLLDGRFNYEYKGDWRKIAKRPKIVKGGRGEYPTPGWQEKDEDGLSLIVSAKLNGDPNVKTHELFLASAWPRNSTLWATNPQQQIAYLGTKQWVRRYAPDAILGVYTPDEIEQEIIVQGERVDEPSGIAETIMTAARNENAASIQSQEKSIPEWPQERDGKLYDMRGNIPWDERIHSANKSCTHDGIWRKRRGISDDMIAEVEAELLGETEDSKPAKQQATEETGREGGHVAQSGPELDEAWFNRMIAQAASVRDLAEIEDVLATSNFQAEIYNGILGKIQHRKKELGEESKPMMLDGEMTFEDRDLR